MDPERWKQIEQLCNAALEREKSQRSAFLKEACGGDETLRREVDSLLAQQQEVEDFIEAPALEVVAKGLAKDQVESLVGQQISSYKILSLLGAGGMGEVYLVQDTTLDRKVALKFLPEELEQDSTARKRFLREAKSAASLDHPYICHIHEVGEVEGKSFIAMEYIQGETLKEKLAQGPLPLNDALEKATEVAEALEEAHKQGIVHRDVKPANIMLTPQGHVKVMDFGLAKQVTPVEGQEQEITTALTQQGSTLGTVPYMSPEQVRGQEVDTRSDIFSFGVVLYEMLSGLNPFKKGSAMDTATAILSETPPPLTRYTDDIPVLLQHTVRKMLAKEPDRRYQHVDELRIDLADLVDEIGGSRVPTEEAVAGPSQAQAPVPEKSWRRATLWGVALLMALTTAVALWSPWQADPSTEKPVSRFAIHLPQGQTLAFRLGDVAISPDGEQLAFIAVPVAGSILSRQLYLRPLNELDSRPMPNVERPAYPVFSPDGKWLAISAEDRLLQKVSLSGGGPQTLGDFGKIGKGGQFSHGWTPDADALIFGSDSGLLRVPTSGGTPETLTTVQEGELFHGWPQILPGGQAVLFTFSRGWQAGYGVALLSLETGKRRTLIEPGTRAVYVPTGHLLYAWEGQLLAVPFDLDELQLTGSPVVVLEGIATYVDERAAFSVSANGSLAYIPGAPFGMPATLVWVDRQGGEEPLAAEARRFYFPRVSPDGSRVATTVMESGTPDIWEGNPDVWIYDLSYETSTRLTFDPAFDGWLLWTPDGQRVVFQSDRHGTQNLYWKAADGTGEVERLTTSDNIQEPWSFSPDGTRLVFIEANPETGWDIGVLSMEGEPTSKPLLQTQFREDHPTISPDGRWMAYISNESGRFEVYVRPFPNVEAGKWQASTGGGVSPLWGPEGRELFYRSPDGEAMMRVPIQTEPRFIRGRPEVLFTGSYFIGGLDRNYDISPDGQRFLMMKQAEQTSAPSQIIVVLNWFEELKRLVPTN